MKKYIWASYITILILLVVWNMTDSAEETNDIKNTKDTISNTVEENQGYQYGLLQDEDVTIVFPEVEESDESEDKQTENLAKTESMQTEETLETEDDAESNRESAVYQKRYEEFQERISEARDYIAGKLPDTDISDDELPEGVCLMDLCEGDLDGDDKPDFAVVLEYELGYEYFSGGEFGLPQEGIRPIYVYTYAEDIGYQCRYEHPDLIAADGYGGMYGDPYAGIEITEGALRVSDFGGDAWKWGDDLFFEMKGEAFVLKERINYESHWGNGRRSIWNYEEGTLETYALALMNEPLLINRGTFEAETVLFQEANMRESQGIENVKRVNGLPYLSYDNGYAGLLDDVQKNAARYTAEEVLDIVKDENYPDMRRVDIVCEEEIFDNYETLLGYEPPRYYYEDDAGNELLYRGQDITTDHTHEIRYYGTDNIYYIYKLSDDTGEILSTESDQIIKHYGPGY